MGDRLLPNDDEAAKGLGQRPPRCATYLRVSTEGQTCVGGETEGFSIPYQREACFALAKARGWEVRVWEDEA